MNPEPPAAPVASPVGPDPGDRLFLVDGTALVYRAHFAFLRNPLITTRGETVSAVYGFAMALVQLLREENPRAMAVAFDGGGPTFRHEQFAAYKAQRPPMPEELARQFPLARALVEAFGIKLLRQEGIEADDLIGSLARCAEREGREIVIVSADKDFMQLLGPRVRQWIPPTGGGAGEWVDSSGVEARWGVRPDQMIDLLALMGDASDNVPGVAGIGPKTAAQLLQRFGSLEGIYEHLEELGASAVRSKLEKDRDSAFLSRELVRIRCDAEPAGALEGLDVPAPRTRPQLARFLKDHEFRRIMELLGLSAEQEWKATYDVLTSVEELRRRAKEWAAAGGTLALHAVGSCGDPHRAALIGLALSPAEGEAAYLPFEHLEAGNLSLEEARPILQALLSDPAVTLVGEDLKSTLHLLRRAGIGASGPMGDPTLAAYLMDPDSTPALESLGLEHLEHRLGRAEDLTGKGRGKVALDAVSIARVAALAGERADVAHRLYNIFVPRLESQGLGELWRHLECPLIEVLARMEEAGVRIEPRMLQDLSRAFSIDLERLTEEIHRLAGAPFNIGSPAQLAGVLFDTLKLPSRKKTKTGRSTDSEVLEELAELHPLPRLLLEHRSLSKLKSTYVDTLPALVHPATGRIHACFNQMVAATGRLSSSDPNLQNIPNRTPLGREIRRAFVAEEGHQLLSADYSQIELRVLAHLSGDSSLVQAFAEGHDVHAATASRLFGVAADQVDPMMRSRAKVVNFGVIYGMGPQRLSREMGIPLEEARNFIDIYLSRMPGVRRYLDETLERARRDGYVTTIFGRRRVVRGLNSGDGRARAQAERIVANTPIQGSAADLVKRAMLEIDRRLAARGMAGRMILQVHDELVLEVPREEMAEAAALVREAMEGAASWNVPLHVELGVGESWAEAHR